MSTSKFYYAACQARFQAGERPSEIVKTVHGDIVRLLEVTGLGHFPITGRICDRAETWNSSGKCHTSNNDLCMIPLTVKCEGWLVLVELQDAFNHGMVVTLETKKPNRPALRIEWETEVV